MTDLNLIISGGQTGVDRGAIGAALQLRFPYGGAIPAGRRAEDGIVPVCFSHMTEMRSGSYEVRTERNVKDADGTLVLTVNGDVTGGTEMTVRIAERENTMLLVLDVTFCVRTLQHISVADRERDPNYLVARDVIAAQILLWLQRKWLGLHPIRTMNVAGPRESKVPGIETVTYDIISRVIQTLGVPA